MSEVPQIEPTEAEVLVADGAVLLDVREDDEWDAGHVAAAIHIPLKALPDGLYTLPTDRRVVAVCRSGIRSNRAAALLIERGYDAVNLAGGMQAWAAASLPIAGDGDAPGRVI